MIVQNSGIPDFIWITSTAFFKSGSFFKWLQFFRFGNNIVQWFLLSTVAESPFIFSTSACLLWASLFFSASYWFRISGKYFSCFTVLLQIFHFFRFLQNNRILYRKCKRRNRWSLNPWVQEYSRSNFRMQTSVTCHNQRECFWKSNSDWCCSAFCGSVTRSGRMPLHRHTFLPALIESGNQWVRNFSYTAIFISVRCNQCLNTATARDIIFCCGDFHFVYCKKADVLFVQTLFQMFFVRLSLHDQIL